MRKVERLNHKTYTDRESFYTNNRITNRTTTVRSVMPRTAYQADMYRFGDAKILDNGIILDGYGLNRNMFEENFANRLSPMS